MTWPDGKFVTYDWYGGPDMLTQDIGGGYSANLTSYVYDELGITVTLSEIAIG